MQLDSLNSTVAFHNGFSMPRLGFGVWELGSGEDAKAATLAALEAGYRLLDTAAAYQNEAMVGEAIRESGIPRSELFITTKLANIHQKNSRQRHGFERSMEALKLDYLDLYIQHWPIPGQYKESWKIMEEYQKQGLVRSIGISNFRVSHMQDLLQDAEVMPALNQLEFNPGLQDYESILFCQEHNIVVQAWSPLGGGIAIKDPQIAAIAQKYGKNGPQVVLRWILQKGIVTITRSSKPERVAENANIFDFALTDADMAVIDALHTGTRTGRNPDDPTTFLYRELD